MGRGRVPLRGSLLLEHRAPQARRRLVATRNVERDPRCAFVIAIHGDDVALEGRTTGVTGDARLQRLAEMFAEGGWAPTVADGGFSHEYSAPSAGPPPWYVYEFTPEDADAVATNEPGGATRWTI